MNVRKLGFSRYLGYLHSDLWKSIRLRVLMRDRFSCRMCGARANQVHHRRYVMSAMDGTNIGLLVSLCGKCHELIEFKDGVKTSLSTANRRFWSKHDRAT